MPPELCKDVPPTLITILTNVINEALKTRKIPDAWRGGTIRFLLKKQPDSEFKNWRPVVLLQVAYNIYARLITERLRDITEPHHLLSFPQEGFRSRHSIQRQVTRLTLLIARAQNTKSTAYLTLVDFQNAFNSAPHACILKVLRLLNIPDLDIIQDLLHRSTFHSDNNVGTTANIDLTRGIKQGGVESPLIFCLFTEVLLRYLEDTNTNPNKTTDLISEAAGYADDLALLSIHSNPKIAESNHAGLHRRLEIYSNWADVHLNIQKCVITSSNFHKPKTILPTHTLTLNGLPLPHIPPSQSTTYLGVQINLNGDFRDEKASVIAKTKKAVQHLRKTVFTRHQVKTLLHMCVIPLFTFSSGLVNWTATELTTINNIWANVRKFAFHLPTQTSSAPFQTHPENGGLDYEPAEWHLLCTQHSIIEQCLSLQDPL